MRKTMTLILGAVLLLAVTPALAQENAAPDTAQAQVKAREMLKVIGLPGEAERAREAGMPAEDVRVVLEEAGKRKLPPSETGDILQECGKAAKENGPVDNFGEFVRTRMNEGMRGRDLANAIREQHRLQGKAKGLQKRVQAEHQHRVGDADAELGELKGKKEGAGEAVDDARKGKGKNKGGKGK